MNEKADEEGDKASRWLHLPKGVPFYCLSEDLGFPSSFTILTAHSR